MAASAKDFILIVDDEWLVGHTLCAILERAGYEALAVSSAEHALEVVATRPPSLVIADVVLQGPTDMTGIDLQMLLTQHAPEIKVILMSGQGYTSVLVEEARARGQFIDVRWKPIQPARLLALIDRLLRPPDSEAGVEPVQLTPHILKQPIQKPH